VVDRERVARAEAGEALAARRRPLEPEPQRRAARAQLEHDVAVVRERDLQDGRAAAPQRELDVKLVRARVRDLGVDRALGEAELLAGDQPFGDPHEAVVHRPLARPCGQSGDEGLAVAGQVDAERPQAHLEAQGTSREHGHDPIFHETERFPRGFTAGSHDVGRAFTDTSALRGILQV
jgi:hypothetical protein